ncbi:MAG TPA: glycosyltransferase [Chryseolinea sp.]|nr:glycosyltransferase [Chryseolinea sp.]
MKSLTITIPFMNNLRFGMPMLGNLKYMTSEEVEWIVVDNGSTDPIEQYIRNYIKPKKLNYIRFEENIGLMETNKLAYETCETDLLMLLHTDCFIFEKDWDKRVRGYFDEIPKLGMAGFFGAQGCLEDGGRLQTVPKKEDQKLNAGLSNMLEAEMHGQRLEEDWRACAIFDSFAMVINMQLLKETKGFDMRYKFHHFYDRDISLESLRHGYKNIIVNVPCHHIGSLTAQDPLYQKWQQKVIGDATDSINLHNLNKEQFKKKWQEVLPICIGRDFHFMTNDEFEGDDYDFKSDKIVGYGL